MLGLIVPALSKESSGVSLLHLPIRLAEILPIRRKKQSNQSINAVESFKLNLRGPMFVGELYDITTKDKFYFGCLQKSVIGLTCMMPLLKITPVLHVLCLKGFRYLR